MASRISVTIPSRGGQPAPSRGIDRRALQSGADTSSVWEAFNCDLTTSGGYRRRDALVEYAELPPHTLGLYALAGKLHVAVPAGHGYQVSLPPHIKGDVFGDAANAATDVNHYVRMTAQSSWGASFAQGALPYIVLKSASGQNIHHWINQSPAAPTAFLKTRIELGFEPGPDLTKAKQKFYAANISTGDLQYSSTEFGPAFWSEADAPDDAGFLAVSEHALSDPNIIGTTIHQGKLVVVFANSMQFWDVDPDPARDAEAFTLNGPGTKVFGSLSPVIGDVYYLSEGGFRSLATQTTTGELREGDIGASILPISPAASSVNPDDVHSLWSQARSQYLCFVNTEIGCTVYAFTLSPTFNVSGWTTWVLPVQVEYATELNGELFLRNGDMIYKLDPLAIDDEVNGAGVSIFAYVETQFLDGNVPQFRKQWMTMDVLSDANINIRVLVDRNDRELVENVALNLVGSTYDEGAVPVDIGANAIGIRFEFNGRGTVEQMTINAIVAAGSR